MENASAISIVIKDLDLDPLYDFVKISASMFKVYISLKKQTNVLKV